MARPYTVALKGGGSITVNASDPQAALANVNDPAGTTGDVKAGGHQNNVEHSGQNDYGPNDTPQSLDPQSNAGGQNAAGTPGTSTPQTTSTSAPGSTPYAGAGGAVGTQFAANMGYKDPSQSVDANGKPTGGSAVGTEYQYGMRPDDTFTNWAQRAFRQGTADFGPSIMNPYVDQNPAALNPYQSWFQSRYGTSAGMNDLVAKTLGGGDFTTGGAGLKNDIQGMMQGNQFGPTDSAGAYGNIQALTGMVDAPHNSNDAGRMSMLDAMQKDPSFANQLVLGQYSNIGGPLMGYLAQRLNNMSQQYGATPSAGTGNGGAGSYWDMISNMLKPRTSPGNA